MVWVVGMLGIAEATKATMSCVLEASSYGEVSG